MTHDSPPEHTWLRYMEHGQAIEHLDTPRTSASLLASKDGTEMIHHTLRKGANWWLVPQHDWNALETVYILSGRMSYKSSSSSNSNILFPGDVLSAEPVREHVVFTALEDVTFLYISSNYVFHQYSEVTQKYRALAIDIEMKDGYTAAHCDRISQLSHRTGEVLGLQSDEQFVLKIGSFFHDIGKINIPNNILSKPGPLSNEEFDIIKTHTVHGKTILTSTNVPHLVASAIIAEQHHERFDGSGYPFGLHGNNIDIRAAIVAVVDSFDAMTSDRPYQSARSKEYALSEITMLRGKWYHPEVVDAFLSVIGASSVNSSREED